MNPEEIIHLCEETRYKIRELQAQNWELYRLMEQLTHATRGAEAVERSYEMLRQTGDQSRHAMEVTDELLQKLSGELKQLLAGMPPVPPFTLP